MTIPEIEELTRRISEEPSDAHLYYQLAKAYGSADSLDEAVKALIKSIQLEPRIPRYRLLLAKIYLKQHKYSQARKQYETVLSLEPSNLKAHRSLGLMFEFYAREPRRALRHYRKYFKMGGDDPRVLTRLKLLEEEAEAEESERRAKEAAGAGRPRKSLRRKSRDTLRRLLALRDKMSGKISDKQAILTGLLLSAGMFLALFLCFETFPVGGYSLCLLVCVAVAAITALEPGLGITAGLAIIFFPMAFHSPVLGYLYAMAALFLRGIYGRRNPGRLIAVLLAPALLKLNMGYSIPIGAGLWLGVRHARRLGIAACVGAIGFMIATNTPHLGPLLVNYARAPISYISPDRLEIDSFFTLRWLRSPLSPTVVFGFIKLFRSLFPALLKPPVVLIHIVSWGLAAHTVARLGKKPGIARLISALAISGVIFLLQTLLIESIVESAYSLTSATIECFFLSALAVSALEFFKIGAREQAQLAPIDGAKDISVVEEVEDVGWDSIGGLEDVKREIQMVTRYQFQGAFSRFTKRFGMKGVRGILFYGPPGCGKTLFAKVLANDVKASFFSIKGSDFRSKWYGESEQNLSNIFEKARQSAPSIIFFDEIDSVLIRRGESESGSPQRDIISLFLNEMDGIKPLRGALVVGATNDPDSIDAAVLRPGRFDKLIYIPLPDAKGREKIFDVHLKQKPVTPGIDLHKLAGMTERFSGADIADVCSKVAEQGMQESFRMGHTMFIGMAGLEAQIKNTKPSVSLESLRKYEELREKFGRRTLKSDTQSPVAKEKYTWAHVGGLKQVRQELIEAIDTPLRKPRLYQQFGITPPKGVLLYGPPGCGKTFLAKVIAGQCGAHFLSVDLKKETTEGIKNWFLRARENKPCILFFDEIDSIATSRDIGMAGTQEVVTQLLIEMDGMEELKQVVVIAATNRPHQIDSALMRPGRFDRLICIPLPDEAARREILKIQLRGKPVARDVDLQTLAARTGNYSSADLSALCYEASMSLIRHSDKAHPAITMADFTVALDKIKASIAPEEIAYFEEMKTRYSR